MSDFLCSDYKKNIELLDRLLYVEENFDIIKRPLYFGGKEVTLYFIDGFAKDEVIEKMLAFLYTKKPEDIPSDAEGMRRQLIPYGETDLLKTQDAFLQNLLSGVTCMVVDGYDSIIGIDCRTYPARGIEEPEKDKVMRGAKDGFVETLIFNTALIRRRIRSEKLAVEMMTGGSTSRTDIAVCYMRDRVNQEFLEEIKKRIRNLKVDALTMNEESLAEMLYKGKWLNPFPKFRYSERPDTAAASILEGSIILLVDNSPSAMILPTTIFDIIESADDYYFPPVTGTYLRISRFFINLLTLFMTPVWLLVLRYGDHLPGWLDYLQITDPIHVPILLQLLILEFAVDGLRLASLSTPNMFSTPLSVIAGIVVGDYAVSSGWFNSETMLYMAFVTIANYSQSSFELGYAFKFMRLILLVLTGLFGWIGFAVGTVFIAIVILSNKTISGKSYVFPLFPLNGKQLARRLFRLSLQKVSDDDKIERQ